VQVDRIKPMLTLPGTQRLKLNCDEPLSKFAIKINLRCYTKGKNKGKESVEEKAAPLPKVGRCMLTLSIPR
jgi:hypothetical protein